jgi:hypothetical protein
MPLGFDLGAFLTMETTHQIPEELQVILKEAPFEWGLRSMMDYLDGKTTLQQIQLDWEAYKKEND